MTKLKRVVQPFLAQLLKGDYMARNVKIVFVSPATGITAIAAINLDDKVRNDTESPLHGLTDDEFVEYWRQRIFKNEGGSDSMPYRIVSDEEIENAEWEFRSAWIETEFNIDMDKARLIHMDKIRSIRNRELAAKDISFMRAVEDGNTDTQATIATEKQTLRDIPQTLDIVTDIDTPEKLKNKWPEGLPKE